MPLFNVSLNYKGHCNLTSLVKTAFEIYEGSTINQLAPKIAYKISDISKDFKISENWCIDFQGFLERFQRKPHVLSKSIQ